MGEFDHGFLQRLLEQHRIDILLQLADNAEYTGIKAVG